MKTGTNPGPRGPNLYLRIVVDPDMGEFYEWCAQIRVRARAREVLTAARNWHSDRSRAPDAPVAAAPQPPKVRVDATKEPHAQDAAAAGLGRRFLSAKPSKEDMG